MKKICLNFRLHQPFRLKRYDFLNIGNDHSYYDDYINQSYTRRTAEISYLPANDILLEAAKELKGKLKISFSVSGTTLDQFELYAPEVLESFRALAETGHVEFIAGTDAHSIASLVDKGEFISQVDMHQEKILRHFGIPVGKVFCNSDMIYNNDVGAIVEEMGFRGVLTEGAKHILGWKSPNFPYYSSSNPQLKLLLRNRELSDHIQFNFSNRLWSDFPLTAEKLVHRMEMLHPKEELINLSLDYSTFGRKQTRSTGIFEFLRSLPKIALKKNFSFITPTESLRLWAVAPLSVQYPVSLTDMDHNHTTWCDNELQKEAVKKLYDLTERVKQTPETKIKIDWKYLQSSDHFRLMMVDFYSSKRQVSDHLYGSAYDAFINYMNVLTDFAFRLKSADASYGRMSGRIAG